MVLHNEQVSLRYLSWVLTLPHEGNVPFLDADIRRIIWNKGHPIQYKRCFRCMKTVLYINKEHTFRMGMRYTQLHDNPVCLSCVLCRIV